MEKNEDGHKGKLTRSKYGVWLYPADKRLYTINGAEYVVDRCENCSFCNNGMDEEPTCTYPGSKVYEDIDVLSKGIPKDCPLEEYAPKKSGAVYIANAFSLQMLDLSKNWKIFVEQVEKKEWDNAIKKGKSIVGHKDTASVFGVEFNRESVQISSGDIVYVGQIIGGRLPEGATSLPESLQVKYVKVTFSCK